MLLIILANPAGAQITTITSSSSTNNICVGGTITLTAGSGIVTQYYQWQQLISGTWTNISAATGLTYGVTASGDYRFKTSFNPSMTPFLTSSTVTINNATALSISNNLSPIDQLHPATLALSSDLYINTTLPPDYTFTKWYKNGVPLSTSPNTMSMKITSPGDYKVIAGGCGIERSNIDIIDYETSHPNWNTTTFATGKTYNYTATIASSAGQGYLVGGDIVIQNGGDVTFACTMNFTGCYKIIVESGGILRVTDNTILSATDQWKGILVEDGGVALINNNTYICDAVAGLIKQGAGTVEVTNTKFGRNAVHMAFSYYDGVDSVLVKADTFGNVIDATNSIVCSGYTPYTNMNIARGINIYAIGLSGYRRIKFHENEAWLTDYQSGSNNSWLATQDQHNLSIMANNISGFYNNAITLKHSINTSIKLNNLINLRLGPIDYGYADTPTRVGNALYMKHTNNAFISDNEIKQWETGVEYYDSINTDSTIFVKNRVRACKYGLIVAPAINPINYSGTLNTGRWSHSIIFAMRCNIFKFNIYGIIGSGNLIQQGMTVPFRYSAGNRFYDGGAGGILNAVHSILWNNTSNINYYFNTVNGDDDPKSRDANINVNIDGTNVNNTGITNKIIKSNFNINLNSCTSLLTGPAMDNNIINNSNNISVYPNPCTNFINISGILGSNMIYLTSMDGKILIQENCTLNSVNLDISNIPTGLYILRINNADTILNFKILKR